MVPPIASPHSTPASGGWPTGAGYVPSGWQPQSRIRRPNPNPNRSPASSARIPSLIITHIYNYKPALTIILAPPPMSFLSITKLLYGFEDSRSIWLAQLECTFNPHTKRAACWLFEVSHVGRMAGNQHETTNMRVTNMRHYTGWLFQITNLRRHQCSVL